MTQHHPNPERKIAALRILYEYWLLLQAEQQAQEQEEAA